MNPLPDLESELAKTRQTLERVPQDKLNWKPDEKSGTMAWMAGHIANLPQWGVMTLNTAELKLDGMQPQAPPTTTAEIVALFDKNADEFRAALKKATDADLTHQWKCFWNGKIIIEAPRSVVLRGTVLNHLIHHRAQLTMYLRMVGVPVPGLYGPSADEMADAMK